MNLFVLWTESYGEALSAANKLALSKGHILDCSIIGKWSQVLVHFDEKPASDPSNNLNLSSKHHKAWIPGLKNQITESYLSLSINMVSDFLLSVETNFVGDVFEFLQVLNLDQFPIVDFRLLRFSEPKVLLLLTGASNDADKLLVSIENLKSQGKFNFNFELVNPVAKPIKGLFNYSDKV